MEQGHCILSYLGCHSSTDRCRKINDPVDIDHPADLISFSSTSLSGHPARPGTHAPRIARIPISGKKLSLADCVPIPPAIPNLSPADGPGQDRPSSGPLPLPFRSSSVRNTAARSLSLSDHQVLSGVP